MSVNHIHKDLPGFPSLQEILGDVFSEVFFMTGGLQRSIKKSVYCADFSKLKFSFLI